MIILWHAPPWLALCKRFMILRTIVNAFAPVSPYLHKHIILIIKSTRLLITTDHQSLLLIYLTATFASQFSHQLLTSISFSTSKFHLVSQTQFLHDLHFFQWVSHHRIIFMFYGLCRNIWPSGKNELFLQYFDYLRCSNLMYIMKNIYDEYVYLLQLFLWIFVSIHFEIEISTSESTFRKAETKSKSWLFEIW